MKSILHKGIVAILLGYLELFGASADDPFRTTLLVDKLERLDNDEKSLRIEGYAYGGYDFHKLYVYFDVEKEDGGISSAQYDLLYSKAIAPFWDFQVGIASIKSPTLTKEWIEIALAGLAPYWFETRLALLAGDGGNVGLQIEAEYEVLFTQRLILTPSIEANFYTKDDSSLAIESGLDSVEAGLRLRYEIKREFAPYIGIHYEKSFAPYSFEEKALTLGVRVWF